jgi:cell wall-associated NlpC family hydrolase
MMEIKDLIGAPYAEHGRSLQGLDCYGCAILAEKILTGKELPDVFYENPTVEQKAEVMKIVEEGVPHTLLDKPEKGAVVEIFVLGRPSHVGVCLGGGMFIHAMKKTGVVIEPLRRYGRRIKGYYRAGH